ncbi:hypothetical protein BO78DRAFT_398229 [Aspergillus sclerotiicarbonarius CBS 121057]|uniref:Mid2 domain-containing protein n=1 Tax=Aspergillus sclerotiicarbonarius (strain CBS 121057 / IBT 28362) TaxID=1448318 RepID=A0A319E675_ASPSB|nr:hypothetical protein BO78DRAFT_398229 [Aspergillus sclerotiicarbonarius CBS 121057]
MRLQRKQWRSAALLLLCSAPFAAAIDCYSHNGIEASSSEYYNATLDGALVGCGTGVTTCCLASEYCDVDLLCHDRDTGGVSRQYCSSPEWPTDKCSALCPQYTAAGVDLTACDDSGTKYCCGPSAEDCCKAGNYTTIDKETGEIIAIGTSTIATTSTTSASSSSSTSTSNLSSLISSATATSATTTAAGSSASSTDAVSEKTSGMPETTKLGIGLGVGLGVPFLLGGAAAIFFWRRSQRKQPSPPEEKGAGLDRTGKEAHLLETNEARRELPGFEVRHELQ